MSECSALLFLSLQNIKFRPNSSIMFLQLVLHNLQKRKRNLGTEMNHLSLSKSAIIHCRHRSHLSVSWRFHLVKKEAFENFVIYHIFLGPYIAKFHLWILLFILFLYDSRSTATEVNFKGHCNEKSSYAWCPYSCEHFGNWSFDQ